MDKLNAEHFYCIDLLNKSQNLLINLETTSIFMNNVYDKLINLPKNKLVYFQSVENKNYMVIEVQN